LRLQSKHSFLAISPKYLSGQIELHLELKRKNEAEHVKQALAVQVAQPTGHAIHLPIGVYTE
jgi:hypothetical protein